MIRNGNVRPLVALPIIITGVGVVSAFGDSPGAFRDALLAGRTRHRAGRGVRGRRLPLDAGRADRRVRAGEWIPPMKLRRMDDTGPLALVIAQQASAQASIRCRSGDDRAGVVLGTCSAGGQATTEYLTALFTGGPPGAPALLFNSTVGNAAAGLAGLELKLRGPNATISHKEASGLAAIVTAVDLLRQGRADGVLAGGIDSIYELFYRVHDRFAVMSDARRRGRLGGTVQRDPAGLRHGRRRLRAVAGARRRPGGPEVPRPSGRSPASPPPAPRFRSTPGPITRSRSSARCGSRWRTPGSSQAEVDVVYASANATMVLDDVEARALTEVFGGTRTVVTSIKGALGESGASGAAACIAAVLCGAVGQRRRSPD